MNVRVIFLPLVFLLGCKKAPIDEQTEFPTATMFAGLDCTRRTNNKDTVSMMIQGTYEWAYTRSYQWRGPSLVLMPVIDGTKRYVFKPDQKVEYYENGRRKWTYDYMVDFESAVTLYPLDSSTVVIIRNESGQRHEFFRVQMCNDSAQFYCPIPYGEIDAFHNYHRK
jgi:hypothetical protein